MPSVQVDEVEHAMNDNEVISELEHVMSDWGAALTEVMQREAEKHPIGTGPLAGLSPFPLPSAACVHAITLADLILFRCTVSCCCFCSRCPSCYLSTVSTTLWPAEIEFWRVRNAAFSSLYEQLNLPSVRVYVSVLEAGSADQNLLTSFKAQFSELKKVTAMCDILPLPQEINVIWCIAEALALAVAQASCQVCPAAGCIADYLVAHAIKRQRIIACGIDRSLRRHETTSSS